jgi:hypothetical protein
VLQEKKTNAPSTLQRFNLFTLHPLPLIFNSVNSVKNPLAKTRLSLNHQHTAKNCLKRDRLVFLIHPFAILAEHAHIKMHRGSRPPANAAQIPACREFETHPGFPFTREFDEATPGDHARLGRNPTRPRVG